MKTNEIIQEDIQPQVGDHFDIELGNMIIETNIVGETNDGYIVEVDDRALALMKISGALLESYQDQDIYTITNPDNQDEEIEVYVEWSSYQDEFEIDKVVRVDTGEDITKKVNGQAYWNLSYNVQQRLQQQRSRGDNLEEAEYQGRKVPLSKPMRGDVKKFKVYVKNEKGNVIKVNFGDKNMKIKKSNPKRRKSFRARHNCANPGPKTKARYWSCRKW